VKKKKYIPSLGKKELERVTWDSIDAIAVTVGPGLISSLLIGVNAATTIARIKNKPLIPVNHIAGHLYSTFLERNTGEFQFPILTLTVSGGHNDLVLFTDHFDFEQIGSTRDDAAGEAFDKVARMLGLGYPGGPVIAKAAIDGNNNTFDFPRAMMNEDHFDFSFSGLKSAVLREIEKNVGAQNFVSLRFSSHSQLISDLAASFQEAVIDVLATKLLRAAKKYHVKEVHLVGGVSANIELRDRIKRETNNLSIQFRHPAKMEYCTDNAAMIGAAAYFQFQKNPEKYQMFHMPKVNVNASLF